MCCRVGGSASGPTPGSAASADWTGRERCCHSSEAVIYWSMAMLMTRLLAARVNRHRLGLVDPAVIGQAAGPGASTWSRRTARAPGSATPFPSIWDGVSSTASRWQSVCGSSVSGHGGGHRPVLTGCAGSRPPVCLARQPGLHRGTIVPGAWSALDGRHGLVGWRRIRSRTSSSAGWPSH